VVLIGSAICAVLFSSCQRATPPAAGPEVDPVQAELEDGRGRLAAAKASLEAKEDELALANAALEAARTQITERDLVVAQRDTQIRAAQSELEAMKKRDAFVFAEISKTQQQGQLVNASVRYQQFLKDFPDSPLALHATNALAEITALNERGQPPKPDLRDSKTRTRDFVQQFEEGYLTLQELAPVLKKRSVSQVLALLGPPNRIFGDGSEIGYVDKAIDPVTSKRGMFIIAFELGVVANLRVEYAGRRMVP
jgi:septal ring factor EnvC (AmiA/AmiB activator)